MDTQIISRSEAKRLQLPVYFTGKKCKRNHIAPRRTDNGTCVLCQNGWSKRNPRKRKDIETRYKKKHPNANKKASAKYRKKYPERRRASVIKWIINNREYCRYNLAIYRAHKLKATPSWVDIEELKRIYKECPKGMEVDHIYPLRGKNSCGLHVPWNLQYLTPTENRKKGNRIIE